MIIKCWASVLVAMILAPVIPISLNLFIVLEPLPPAPITAIFGALSSRKAMSSSSSFERGFVDSSREFLLPNIFSKSTFCAIQTTFFSIAEISAIAKKQGLRWFKNQPFESLPEAKGV